jgi:hypothetical protein
LTEERTQPNQCAGSEGVVGSIDLGRIDAPDVAVCVVTCQFPDAARDDENGTQGESVEIARTRQVEVDSLIVNSGRAKEGRHAAEVTCREG